MSSRLTSLDNPGLSADGVPALTPPARALAEHLASLLGPTTRAILHYGSHAQGRLTRQDSAFDFFIIVDSYRSAYRALSIAGGTRNRLLANTLAWVLPPNAMAARTDDAGGEREAKCLVFSMRHFERECSPHARDHFVGARMAQSVLLAWCRDSSSAAPVLRCLAASRVQTFVRVCPSLPAQFDVTRYCRRMLEVSLANEVRPETAAHANTLFMAQELALLAIHGPVLEQLVARGVLAHDGKEFVQRHRSGSLARWRTRAFFRVSKVRTGLRLLKHPFVYDGWLDYVLRKIDRSTGTKIELTERERRWPLIFLWPRAYRYLRTRPQHHA